MAIHLRHDSKRRGVIGWVGLLALIGACMAASGSLDWPLIDTARSALPADFRQAATNVIFNLWFLASGVTLFALVQRALERPARDRLAKRAACAARPDGSLTRREFLLVAGGVTLAATGLVGLVRLLRDSLASSTEDASSTAETGTLVPVGLDSAAPAATAVPASDAATTTSTTAQTVANGRRLCDRGCSYPGHCGRYQDSNGNSVCDLTEAIW